MLSVFLGLFYLKKHFWNEKNLPFPWFLLLLLAQIPPFFVLKTLKPRGFESSAPLLPKGPPSLGKGHSDWGHPTGPRTWETNLGGPAGGAGGRGWRHMEEVWPGGI